MKGFGNTTLKKNLNTRDFLKEKFKKEAFKYYKRGDLDSFLKYCTSFISNGYKDVELFSQFGIVLFELGYIEKSIDTFERSICIFPNEPDLYINLSNVYKLNGDLTKSEVLIRKSLEIYPESHIALSNLSIILIDKGQFIEAEKYALIALEIDQENSNYHYNLGLIYSNTDRFNASIISYKKALQFDPKNYAANLNLGAILLKLGNFEESQKYLEIALSLKTKSYESEYNLGQIYLFTKKFEKAEEHFRKALIMSKNNYEIHRYLGIVQFMNSSKECLKNINKSIELNPKKNISHVLKSIISSRKISIDSNNDMKSNYYGNFGNTPVILNRKVDDKLIDALYERDSLDLNEIDTSNFSGNALGSSYKIFEESDPVLKVLENDLTKLTSEYFKSDIFIDDSFFRLLKGEGKVRKHTHLDNIDKLEKLDLYKNKFSLVYYIKTGDTDSSEPGFLNFYNPKDRILPKPGMIIIFPSDRPHSVIYDGKSDRMIFSINFYCY